MIGKKLISVIVFSIVLLTQQAWSQKVLSGEPDKFIRQLEKRINSTKNDEAKLSYSNFLSVWSTLSQEQQERTMGVIRYMDKNQFGMHPNITGFIDMVYFGIGFQKMSDDEIASLLEVSAQTLKRNKPKEFNAFVKNTKLFLSESVLGRDRNGDVLVKEGKITFRYLKFEEFISSEDEEIVEEEEDEMEEVEKEEETSEDEWGDDSWGSDDGWDSDDGWEDDGWDEWGTVDQPIEEESDEGGMLEDPDALFDAMYQPPILPGLKGPVVDVENTDLIFKTESDFATLYATTIHMRLLDNTVVGEGGTFDWATAGIPQAKAELKTYTFDASKPVLDAEGVTFYYPEKIEGGVEGVFQYKSVPHATKEEATYPRFMSYKSDVKVIDFPEDIVYQGGFGLRGSETHTQSVSGSKSDLKIFKDSVLKVHAISRDFLLGDSVFTAEPCAVFIHHSSKDSIHHPGVGFKYERDNQHLRVLRKKGNFKFSPYKDFFHGLDIDCDIVEWDLDTAITFSMGSLKESEAAYFSSFNNFNLQEFIRLRSLYPFHPLQLIARYVEKEKKQAFYAGELAEFMKYPEKTVRHSMVLLMAYGYVDYDPRSGFVKITDKAIHYIGANRKKRDYDNINIKSFSPERFNAVYSLVDSVLTVFGVDQFELSDSNNVYCFPNERKIEIYKNRKIKFDGKVLTESYEFSGTDFTFDYEKFAIDLKNIDSIKFQVEIEDTLSESKETKKIDNKLSYSSGVLEIDKPNNKSGYKNYSNYPHFGANDGASVLFNNSGILGGVYDTTLQYKIPPFKLDSIGDSDYDAGVSFDGDFQSSGIFPDFKEELIVQEDLSLGFKHETPEEGYSLYNTDADFFGEISMSKRGLRGTGYIKFLNTTLYSQDFVFFPDSVLAIGDSAFTIQGTNELADNDVTFPKMDLNEYEMKWLPKEDSMLISTFGRPFQFYNDRATLIGNINITTKGTLGSGIVASEGARTISDFFQFEEQTFVGHLADFQILSDQPGKPAMRSDLVKVEVDVEKAYATFEPESEGIEATNEFPFLSYKTSLTSGEWLIDQRKVVMEKAPDAPLSSSYFYSTRAIQDSVHFNASKAVYVMDSLKLFAQGIPYIEFADGKIYPNGSKLTIAKDARIETLADCEVVLDSSDRFHTFVNSNLNILSINRMVGDAVYKYVNNGGDTMDIVFNRFEFNEWTLVEEEDPEEHTYSQAKITEEDRFYIAPNTLFRGTATMYSKIKPLIFEGQVKIDLGGAAESDSWINFFKDDDSKDVVVDLASSDGKKKQEEDPQNIAGFYFNPSYRYYYGKFLSPPNSAKDVRAFKASGLLNQNFTKKEFEVGDTAAVNGTHYKGNVFIYKELENKFEFKGKFDVVNESGQNINHHYAGKGINNIIDSTINTEGVLVLDFDFNNNWYDAIAEDLIQKSQLIGTPKTLFASEDLFRDIANIAQDEKAATNLKKLVRTEAPTLTKSGKEFSNGFVFAGLKMNYSPSEKAWYSVGTIPLSNIGKQHVNCEVIGAVEITKSRTMDRVDLYLALSNGLFYYISLNRNRLSIYTYNDVLNTEIADKMNLSATPGEYSVELGRKAAKNRFLNAFKRKYLEAGDLAKPAFARPDADLGVEEVEEIEIIEDDIDDLDLEESLDDELDDLEKELDELDDIEEDDFFNTDEIEEEVKEEEAIEENVEEEAIEEIEDAVEEQAIDSGEAIEEESDELEESFDDLDDLDDLGSIEETVEEIEDDAGGKKKKKKKKGKEEETTDE